MIGKFRPDFFLGFLIDWAIFSLVFGGVMILVWALLSWHRGDNDTGIEILLALMAIFGLGATVVLRL